MNVRKPVDYSAMFAALDTLMAADLPQTKLYCEIGWVVSSRPEKGAAVAAAEYLRSAYPDVPGFSPRNLRRMREFYRAYKDTPKLLAEAMTIGWTQNVVILEADLTFQERSWYIQAVQRFGWSKLALLEKIELNSHMEAAIDFRDEVCYTEDNNTETERKSDDEDTLYLPREHMSKPNGRICNEGPGAKSGAGEPVLHRVRRHQHRGNWQSGLSPGPPQAGRTRHRLHGQNGPPAEKPRLRPVRSSDWNGPGQPAEYAPHLRRRLRR